MSINMNESITYRAETFRDDATGTDDAVLDGNATESVQENVGAMKKSKNHKQSYQKR